MMLIVSVAFPPTPLALAKHFLGFRLAEFDVDPRDRRDRRGALCSDLHYPNIPNRDGISISSQIIIAADIAMETTKMTRPPGVQSRTRLDR